MAHFIHRYPPALGGSEAYFGRLSRHLAAAGHEVSVFTSNAFDLEAFWSRRGRCLPAGDTYEDGVQIRRYQLLRAPGLRYALKLAWLMPHRHWQALTMPCNPISLAMWHDAGRGLERFDVVHATAFPYAWPIDCARRLALRLDIPFMVTPFLHLGDPDDAHDPTRRAYTQPALLTLLRDATRIFVQTETERQALLDRGFDGARLVLQGMGLDETNCTGGDRQAVRSKWQVGDDAIVVGHLANHSFEKGTIDLLRAAELCWQQGARFTVKLAGPSMPNFDRFWTSFASKQQVTRLGILSEAEKRDFFAGIDVFALPSRSDSFGIVLLEAWANGVPNIGYRAGGITSVIRHEQDGLLVRCGDIAALAVALCRLEGDGELRQRLGQSGQSRARRDFRWPDKLALVEDCYAAASGE